MSDISALSNEDLMKLIGPQQSAAPTATPTLAQPAQSLSALSDADLLAHIKATAPQPSVGADVLKSAGLGPVEAAIGTAGTIGDIRSALSSGASYVGGKLGLSPQAIQTGKDIFQNIVPSGNLIAAAPTSADITGAVENVTGPFYQSQTGLGQGIRTVGQYSGGLVGGPGGIVRRAITQVALPAAASMLAGKATEGTGYEPYAKGAAAFLTGAGAGALANRAPRSVLPTAEQIRTAGSAGYEHPIVQDVRFKPQAVQDFADTAISKLEERFAKGSDSSGQAAFGPIERLKQRAEMQGRDVTINDVRNAQSQLSEVMAERNAIGKPTANAKAATVANDQIRNFLDGISPSDVTRGDLTRALPIIKAANQDWAAQAKSFDITGRLTKAERQSARAGTGIQQAIKTKISPVLDNPNLAAGFKPAELAQAEKVVTGTPLENLLRGASRLSYVPVLGHLGTAAASMGLSVPFQVAGALAKAGSTGITQRNARLLDEMIRRRSALAQQPQFQTGAASVPSPLLPGVNIANPYFAPPPNPWNPLYSGLIAASGANR